MSSPWKRLISIDSPFLETSFVLLFSCCNFTLRCDVFFAETSLLIGVCGTSCSETLKQNQELGFILLCIRVTFGRRTALYLTGETVSYSQKMNETVRCVKTKVHKEHCLRDGNPYGTSYIYTLLVFTHFVSFFFRFIL